MQQVATGVEGAMDAELSTGTAGASAQDPASTGSAGFGWAPPEHTEIRLRPGFAPKSSSFESVPPARQSLGGSTTRNRSVPLPATRPPNRIGGLLQDALQSLGILDLPLPEPPKRSARHPVVQLVPTRRPGQPLPEGSVPPPARELPLRRLPGKR